MASACKKADSCTFATIAKDIGKVSSDSVGHHCGMSDNPMAAGSIGLAGKMMIKETIHVASVE